MLTADYGSVLKWMALLLLWSPWVCVAHDDETTQDNLERIVWRKTPIDIPLVVGEERLVHFPGSVSVGVPPALTPALRSQSINGTLYLLAHQPFERTRVLVRSETGGPLYVLDVSAHAKHSESLVLPDVQVMLETPDVAADASQPEQIDARRAVPKGYVGLTRYAAQQLYAPTRLIPNPRGVVVMPIHPQPVDLLRGGRVVAVPVAAWKAGRHYVTAVKLTNRTAQAVVLDPRELRGAWLAATFQHNRLLPAGSDADTTAVYLVSDRPFDVSR